MTATRAATVRATVMRAPATLEVDAFPLPELEDCAVPIRVSDSGVCGTDKHAFRAETEQYPGTPHEREIEYSLVDFSLVARPLAGRIGHIPGKGVVFRAEKLALNGPLDHRWPAPAAEMPWNFAVVGRGHGLPWCQALLTDLAAAVPVKTIAIEHEDPFVAPEIGIQQAARLLAEALGSAARMRVNA